MTPTAAVSGMCLALVQAVFSTVFVAVLWIWQGRGRMRRMPCAFYHSTTVWDGQENGAAV